MYQSLSVDGSPSVVRLHTKFKSYIDTGERRWTTVIVSLVIPIPFVLMGLTVAYPSSATLDLTGEATELPDDFFLSTLQVSLFAAIGPFAAIFGGPLGGWIADCWGRKCGMMFCGVPYLIGFLLLSYAHYTPTATTFKVLLLTGLFACGIGFGWTSAVVPVYLGEVPSKKLRGVVGAIGQGILAIGVMLSYVLGAIGGFRYYYISLVAVGIVALFEVLMIWLPETPRWLFAKGHVERAESVLLWLRGKKIDITEELEEIEKVVVAKKNSKKNMMQEFLRRGVIIPFIYVLTSFVFQQIGGVSAVFAFAAAIFSEAGVANPRVMSIYAVGVVGVIGNFSIVFVVDSIGRRTLLILSGAGMCIACAMLGIHFFITRPSLCSSNDFNNNSTSLMLDTTNAPTTSAPCNSHFAPLAIASLVLYRFSYSIGLGPIPYILLSEMLPLSVRGFASGLVGTVMWLTVSAVAGLYLKYVELVEQWFVMWTFALFNLLSVLFTIVFIPETKGKSIEELERKFAKKLSNDVKTDLSN